MENPPSRVGVNSTHPSMPLANSTIQLRRRSGSEPPALNNVLAGRALERGGSTRDGMTLEAPLQPQTKAVKGAGSPQCRTEPCRLENFSLSRSQLFLFPLSAMYWRSENKTWAALSAPALPAPPFSLKGVGHMQ